MTKLSSFLTTILHIFGLWPNTSVKKAYRIRSYTLHFITSFLFCLFMLINLMTNLNDIEKMIESLYPTLVVLAYIFKLLNYYKYGENIINSLSKLSNLQLFGQSDDKIFNFRLSDLSKLTSLMFCVSNFAWCVACSKTFLVSNTELPVPSRYPIDWRGNKLYFWIVYIHQSVGGFILVNCNIGMDCLAYYLMGMVAAHFEILQSHIKLIGSNIRRTGHQHLTDSESIDLSIKLCVDEHQQILE